MVVVLSLVGTGCASQLTDRQPPTTDPAVIAQGAGLYQATCAECHGSKLQGTDRGPSHLSDVYVPGHHGDAVIALAIVRGVSQHHWGFGDMPPVEGLNGDEIDAIIAFIRDAQETQGFHSG